MHTESAHNKVEHDLIKGHYEEVKNGDVCLICNVQKNGVPGYIGGNTFLEIGFAYVLNKPIYLLKEIPEVSYRDELEAMNLQALNGSLDIFSDRV